MTTTSIKDDRYIDLAIREAYKSEMYTRHGCVIVVNGKIIGRGHNNYRTTFSDNPMKNGCSCHAEMDALRKAFKSKKCTGYYTTKADVNKHRHSKVANPQC